MLQKLLSCIADPTVYEVNRRSAHATLPPSAEDVCSLDGAWGFQWFDDVRTLDEALLVSGEPEDTVQVPGHLQLMGYGTPQYTNVAYPWDGQEPLVPPEIPQHNPAGLYCRTFTLPARWRGRRVLLTLEGAEPCCFVTLNGRWIGYAEDSFTPSEFELTQALVEGENRLCVIVPRYCTASWLEDQDFWRFSGLFRSVYLEALNDVSIRDVELVAEPDADLQAGTLTAHIHMETRLFAEATVTLSCGGQSASAHVTLAPDACDATLGVRIERPKLWSAEEPNLYDVDICVTAADGAVLAKCTHAVGFRRFEMKDGIMLLNGKRIVFRGVDRHEWSAERGRALTRDEIETDIRLLKCNNFNAVRTSHYPNQPYFYELCDRYGLYVVDETNLETHGTWMLGDLGLGKRHILPDNKPEWRDAVLDRGRSMLERDKNHPCILIWSCGNESYGGETIFMLSQYFHARDPRRLVHYEGIFHDRRYPDTSDMESRMYEKPLNVERYLRSHPKKPFILCEYAHAMGNSFGNVDEYTRLSRIYPQYQGGFIWDWIDQGLRRGADAPIPDAPYGGFCVGGDFCDRPNDRYFCGDGLLFADRTPSPKLAEAKYLYAPVRIDCAADAITVHNDRAFTDTGDLSFTWTLTRDGESVREGTFTLAVPPDESRALRLQLLALSDGEWILTCSATQKADTLYAGAGHEVAFGQTVLKRADMRLPKLPPANVFRGFANIGADMANSHAILDRRTGLITSLVRGQELLDGPILPLFWRAPTDNDIGAGMPCRWAKWKTASLYRLCSTAFLSKRDGRVRAWFLSSGVLWRMTYTFYRDDTLDIELRLFPTPGDAPQVGLSIPLREEYTHFTWYGNGMQEASVDRRNACRIRWNSGEANAQYVPYLNPQDCANKTDVRQLCMFSDDGPDGTCMTLTSNAPFEASVLPWTSHELEQADSAAALPRSKRVVLSVAGRKCGVGGDDSWGARVHKQYRVHTWRGVRFTLRIRLHGEGD